MSEYHIPVLLDESIDGLDIDLNPNGVYVDATMGGAGHTKEILKRLGPKATLFSFDRDSDAIANAPKDQRFIAVHNNFRFIENFIKFYKINGVDGILADLGVSSHQFDTSERGFSFRFSAPLDMRMNRIEGKSAADIVNNYSQEELARIFKDWGELDNPRKVAMLVCTAREKESIVTTEDLCNSVSKMYNEQSKHKFLAKLFQSLRIEVNGEMQALEDFLIGSLNVLKVGGRFSVITYHSIEDRMVKKFFKYGNCSGNQVKDFYGKLYSPFDLINKKPITPKEKELIDNSRSRSAKLRLATKVECEIKLKN